MWEREQHAQQPRQGYYEGAEQVIDIGMVDEGALNAYIARVFGWMFIGLLVTALTTLGIVAAIGASPAFEELLMTSPFLFIGAAITNLILVISITARVAKMNPATSKFLFMVYAALNGLTFGFAVLIYAYGVFANPLGTVGLAFGITAVAFGVMAVYGMATKRDLTRFGNLLFMGLIGFIIASVANGLFIGSWGLDFLIIVGGLFLFMGLTAYKAHNIKHMYAQIALSENGAAAMGARVDQQALASNLAISGALSLYLSFINMFWLVLRLLGRRS